MLENMNLNKLDDSTLKRVSGGDYGDWNDDCDPNNSRYQIGQKVQVYTLWFHFNCTYTVTIEKKRLFKKY